MYTYFFNSPFIHQVHVKHKALANIYVENVQHFGWCYKYCTFENSSENQPPSSIHIYSILLTMCHEMNEIWKNSNKFLSTFSHSLTNKKYILYQYQPEVMPFVNLTKTHFNSQNFQLHYIRKQERHYSNLKRKQLLQ